MRQMYRTRKKNLIPRRPRGARLDGRTAPRPKLRRHGGFPGCRGGFCAMIRVPPASGGPAVRGIPAETTMSAASEGFVHPEYLIETEELAARVGDPNLVVLDSTTHLIPDPKITYTVKPGSED